MNQTISHNSDFLFLYEASGCNPNGDPDQENKPRMDYDTKTNLVTDVRLKRYLRDHLKEQGHDIFVDMLGDAKVSMESKMIHEIDRVLQEEATVQAIFADAPALLERYEQTLASRKPDEKISDALKRAFASTKSGDKGKGKEKASPADKEKALELNIHILTYLVQQQFIDIRLFGSAFAVKGFTRSFTGPVQINWGHSLHPVELMESNSLVTIMNDDNSTFGKDYRVHYSLLAFHGTINQHQARRTGMTAEDRDTFRAAIWDAIPTQLSRSKQNQYPCLYLELVYAPGKHNGQLGDLRQYIQTSPVAGKTEKQIRSLADLDLDFSQLQEHIDRLREEGILQEVILKKAPALAINLQG